MEYGLGQLHRVQLIARHLVAKREFGGAMIESNSPYFIDFPRRIKQIQAEMDQRGLDVYLGSRLRTLSWTLDAFCPGALLS